MKWLKILSIPTALFSLSACISWTETGRGGAAELHLEDLLTTEADYPVTPAHGLRYDFSLEKNHLSILVLQGARFCFPAAVVEAKLREVRIAREIVGRLYGDAEIDIIVQRQHLSKLERKLNYVLRESQCVPPVDAHQKTFTTEPVNNDHLGEATLKSVVRLLNSDNQFVTDSSAINPKYAGRIREAIDLMEGWSFSLSVVGHADERGSLQHNVGLSMRRANTVKAFLIRNGLDASRVAVRAAGESEPLYEGSNPETFLVNRAVEISVTMIGQEK